MTNRSDTGYLRYLEAKRAEKQEKFEAATYKIKIAALQRKIEELKEQLELERQERNKTQQTASINAEKIALVIGIKEQARKWYIESQEHHKTKSELQECRATIVDYEKRFSAQGVMVEALLKMSITANVQNEKEAEFQKLREDLEKARSDLFEMDLDRKEKTMELEAAKKTIEGVKSDMKKVLEKL
ncbi:hypothetical protein L5515_012528 [Caenorhabditis briggsae]|nr:hypothetical protein L5515_012528 [Caenorhabditis briggsae]